MLSNMLNNILAINKTSMQVILNISQIKYKKLIDILQNKFILDLIIKLLRSKNQIIKEE